MKPSSVSTPAQDATALTEAPNDAISAVMAEAYGMLGLELTLPQSRRLANAALRATSQTPDAVREALMDDVLSVIRTYRDHEPEEDESWESWYYAAFDLALARIREVFGKPSGEFAALSTPSASAGPQDAGLREATAAQHFGLPKGQPAQFVRNGILETCQCRDCSKHESAVAVEALTYIKAVIENNAARCDDLLFDLDGETFDKNNGSVLGVIAVCQQMKASLDALATHVASAGPQAEAAQATTAGLPLWQQIQFALLMGKLADWRSADHEDFISIGRSDVIAIIDAVNTLKAAQPQQQQADGRGVPVTRPQLGGAA